ncbi:hypothetical protein [Hymenobacter cellulosivorans]|uniref:Uncharacterized protein n=1 Tax=Hymenobacter cellulosivorans TaxID=2932249 RepID=A0ABY4F653_9BACT|nr:hypothetical protein [Hymenobacter cellulosivorans]UOQ51691.1 hypothetical protein MUN80_18235 [Hymenobacter cellulosivorans]
MKSLLLILLLSLPGLVKGQHKGYKKPQKVTLLRIDVFAYLGTEQHYTITADSLVVKDLSMGATDTLYTRRLTPTERNWLLAPFDQIYLSSIRDKYEPARISNLHDISYRVVLYKGEFMRVTDIYKKKVRFFDTFVQRFNRLVPTPYQMYYTAEYFK